MLHRLLVLALFCVGTTAACSSEPESNHEGPCEMPCSDYGLCFYDHGSCTIPADGDCDGGGACTNLGRCTYDQAAGGCRPSTSEHCANAKMCTDDHIGCAFDDVRRECVMANDADCKAWTGCKHAGRCTYAVHQADPQRDGPKVPRVVCETSEEACQASDNCRQYGLCHPDERSERCEAKSQADCDKAETCDPSKGGPCTFVVFYCERVN